MPTHCRGAGDISRLFKMCIFVGAPVGGSVGGGHNLTALELSPASGSLLTVQSLLQIFCPLSLSAPSPLALSLENKETKKRKTFSYTHISWTSGNAWPPSPQQFRCESLARQRYVRSVFRTELPVACALPHALPRALLGLERVPTLCRAQMPRRSSTCCRRTSASEGFRGSRTRKSRSDPHILLGEALGLSQLREPERVSRDVLGVEACV